MFTKIRKQSLSSRRTSRKNRRFEQLEPRTLLSAAGWEGSLESSLGLSQAETNGYIVVFNDNANAKALGASLGEQHGFRAALTFEHALKGVFVPAGLPEAAVRALQNNPNVKYVEPNLITELPTLVQISPTGLDRIDVDQVIQIDGVDDAVNATVAVIDFGVHYNHPDLNFNDSLVFGWKEETTGRGKNKTTTYVPSYDPVDATSSYATYTHGNAVATVLGAVDNDIGTVGAAPGVDIVSVRASANGVWIETADVVAAVDHVVAHADQIDVANLSIGVDASQAIRDAVQSMIDVGVITVLAAGNDFVTMSDFDTSPQDVDDAILVSAMAGSDGAPGGLGPATSYGADDTFASFSNFGPEIDIMAPGVDIHYTSSIDMSQIGIDSGTSFSAPYVAAGVALYVAEFGNDINGDGVRNRDDQLAMAEILRNTGWQYGESGYILGGDPDGIHEPLLNVARLMGGPSVEITSLANNQIVSGLVTVIVEAAGENLTSLEFYADGSSIGIDTDGSDGWSVAWDSTSSADGSHSIAATVTDDQGRSSSDVVLVYSDNIDTPPLADAGIDQSVVDSDDDGSQLVALDGSASSDDRAITNYEWYEGATLIASDAMANVSFDVGTHAVTLVVTDDGGQTDSDSVTVTITEPPAGIEIYVFDIRFDSKRGGKDWRAVVEIRDVDGNAVEGVSLKVDFNGATYNLTTDSSGIARTAWERDLADGTYVTDAYDLALAGYFWDPFTLHFEEDDSDGDGYPDDVLVV